MTSTAANRLETTSRHLQPTNATMATAPVVDAAPTKATPAVDNEIKGRLALITGASGG